MKWSEYDQEESQRLAIAASDLHSDVEDLEFVGETDDERDMLEDARFHARKLQRLLYKLATAVHNAASPEEA